jgi:hypothetical protein
MPWVPVKRAGSAGGNSGRVGSCKHMQTPPDWMLGVPSCCWVHLAEILGREKTYLGSSILINIYPALSAAIGGRDRMDCSRALWMTCSNYRTHHQSWLLGALPCCWAHLAGVLGREKMYLGSSILINIYRAPSAAIGGQDGMD